MASASPSHLWVLLGLGIAGVIMMSRRVRRAVKADFGAFVERFELLPPPQPAPPKAPHPLTGLTFAVADVFDIAGYITGFGYPDWIDTHDAAARTSLVVGALVAGGATCVGKTVIDEFAYGTSGENKHFETPTNPAAPDRIPGGCSSGSSVAVATGLVDFSLGLFAKDPSIMRRVSHVLLQLPYADPRQPRNLFIADDCFQLLKIPSSRVTQVVIKSVEKKYGRQILKHINLGEYLASKVSSLKQLQNGKKKDDSVATLLSLANAMRTIHRHEFRCCHEEWIRLSKPVLSSFISAEINQLGDSHMFIDFWQSARNEARIALNGLLKDDGILVLPTVLGPPPKLNGKEKSSEDYLTHSLCLTSIASMSGCCQITVPIGFHEKNPVSVSFVAKHGGDRFLLDVSQNLYVTLKEQAEIVSKFNFSSSGISKEESAETAKDKGNMAFKEKQWLKAINLYTEAIKLNGKKATYHSNRAAAYLELGSYLQAEADCSAAINLDAKNVKAHLRRGTAREMLGYYNEAIEDFKYALILEPTNKTANLAVNRLRKLFQ